ncbi:MAG: prepilin-type N-terminal cleavage/methylation domain-containing protein [Candidatus Aminicenantes bacterium]|nr:prepilin-type N-terminal cleavage/methylation domain-containing protein [Candidatus Aminicenantes bacterium]
MFNLSKRSGFSLIEILVVMFILTVVLFLLSSSIFSKSSRHYLDKSAYEVYARMNQARYKAIFAGTKVRVVFSSHSCSSEIFQKNDNTWKLHQRTFLEHASIDANNSPIFHPIGTVSNLASIYIRNDSGAYKITLAISGRIKLVKLTEDSELNSKS